VEILFSLLFGFFARSMDNDVTLISSDDRYMLLATRA
jgi:hypothetical protein